MSLRDDALAIWQAGVDAVRSERLVANVLHADAQRITVCGCEYPLSALDRVVVLGAGKAGAGMAQGVEQALGPVLGSRLRGWVNVPGGCERPLSFIHLHPARPAGVNEPTEAGVAGSAEILRLAQSIGPHDLCLVLLSGGGSALLPAPAPPISLADKQAVTRFLMRSGADIGQLNTVRKQLSLIKGGGLARAVCTRLPAPRPGEAPRVQTLIISDVVGDPLDIIASGPTVPDSSTPQAALSILERFQPTARDVPAVVIDYLRSKSVELGGGGWENSQPPSPSTLHHPPATSAHVANHIIGNNATALAAATAAAESLGYAVQSLGSENTGDADQTGRNLLDLCLTLRAQRKTGAAPHCILSGGEPVVQLTPTDKPRKGGRNQQLVLAAVDAVWNSNLHDIALLSGGTDGEDGPTDAAGAFADEDLLVSARARNLDPHESLKIQNAYHFFDACDGLLKTGPTHTNVMDLRVALIGNT